MAQDSTQVWLEYELAGSIKRFDLPLGADCRVGRGHGNELVLPDATLSRNHCLFQVTGSGVVWLSDRGSWNGTYVNGSRIQGAVQLHDLDRVQIGTVHMTIRCGSDGPGLSETTDSSERTQVLVLEELITVLVADVRGYTVLSQQVDSGLLAEMMSRLNRRSSEIMEQSGAWSVKFLGDAVMALWRHQRESESWKDLIRVIGAIRELHAVCAELSKSLPPPHSIRMGVGVNTGIAAVGQLGSKAAADFTALGEAVNRAFRLETATKETGHHLLLGERSYELVQRAGLKAHLFQKTTAHLKGYEQPVVAYGMSADDVALLTV